MLRKVVQVLYTFWDEEDQLRRNVEQVSHEIQTRLQSVVAEAENLTTDVAKISLEETKQRLENVYTVLWHWIQLHKLWGSIKRVPFPASKYK